jgi:hypothetical protein
MRHFFYLLPTMTHPAPDGRFVAFEVYTHTMSDVQRDAVNKLGDVLFLSVPKLRQIAAGPGKGTTLIH